MARVLGAARLSRETDESTSMERQHEQIDLTTRARGDVLVDIAEDTDVSGAVSPFGREGLGQWFLPPLADTWDILMVPKLDRLTRSLEDFLAVYKWCDSHGKSIVSVSEMLDLSTPIGRMFAKILAMFAEFERERIGERRAESAAKAKREGRYDGGPVHFGYMPVNGRFVKHPVNASIAAEMAADKVAGRSWSWIARKLNADDRVNDTTWRADRVKRVLTSPALNGIITVTDVVKEGGKVSRSDPRILRGEDGMPLKFTDDPIIDDGTWLKLQASVGTIVRGQREGGFMLTAIASHSCGKPLYGNRRPGNAKPYYRCASGATDRADWCGGRTIPMEELETGVTDAVLNRWGDRELYRRVVTPGRTHDDEIALVESHIKGLDLDSPDYDTQLASLRAERARLKALPAEPATDEWQPAGITVAGHWAALESADDKAHLLKSMGVRAVAERHEDGSLGLSVYLGTPEGFEQASGLLLPHTPEDHEPTYSIAGVLMNLTEGGTYVILKDDD